MKNGLTLSAFVAATSIAMLGGAQNVQAHATSIGYENGGGVGIVNIWLGTYNHGTSSHHLEGSMNLVGVNGNTYASTTNAFTLGAGVGMGGAPKPSGLIDGTTNFYNPNGCTFSANPLVATPNTCGGGVDHWQGAVFAGLAAGDYQFTWTPIANPTAEWSVLNSSMNGIFTLSGTVINAPEPGTLSLLALGLAGLASVRRKKQA